MSSLRKQHKQLDQDRLEVYEARSEVDMARQEFNRLQAKLNEGFEDLHAKRSEVLKDIEKENARLARSWEQVKAARKEIEDHQAKLIKTWEQIEAAKIETGMAVTPRPALQRISLQGSSFARPTKVPALPRFSRSNLDGVL